MRRKKEGTRVTEQMMKKKWTEPELIVLVRNNQEEAVLSTCKWATTGPAADLTNCMRSTTGCVPCEVNESS